MEALCPGAPLHPEKCVIVRGAASVHGEQAELQPWICMHVLRRA